MWRWLPRLLAAGAVAASELTDPLPDPLVLSSCSNDLLDLAEYIRYSVLGCPSRAALFDVDGVPVHETLEYLARRLGDNQNHCPCVGPCEEVECLED